MVEHRATPHCKDKTYLKSFLGALEFTEENCRESIFKLIGKNSHIFIVHSRCDLLAEKKTFSFLSPRTFHKRTEPVDIPAQGTFHHVGTDTMVY